MIARIPRKALGQHFLHEKSVIDLILRHFNAQPEDTVVEIGPGHGALTFDLLPQVHQLHVVELDRHLARALERKGRHQAGFFVHHADALDTNFCELTPVRHVRVIGNLPYNISTPLLFHLIRQRSCIRDICCMLQKEVAERILARPGTKQYGRLSVMIQQSCAVDMVSHVKSRAFTPAPKVDSVVLHLLPYTDPPYPVANPASFEQIVRVAFSQRRKTLRNALKTLLDQQQIENLGIDPRSRPEQLEISEFVKLSGLL